MGRGVGMGFGTGTGLRGPGLFGPLGGGLGSTDGLSGLGGGLGRMVGLKGGSLVDIALLDSVFPAIGSNIVDNSAQGIPHTGDSVLRINRRRDFQRKMDQLGTVLGVGLAENTGNLGFDSFPFDPSTISDSIIA